MSTLPLNPTESFKKRNPHLYTYATGIAPTGDEITIITKSPRRIRQSSKPLMNKLETELYARLKSRFSESITVPQGMRFRLGNGVWYKPDFVVFVYGFDSQDKRLRAFEVKGEHAFRGGFENLKVAASQYPQIIWTLVWKESGAWKEQVVRP